MDGRKYGRELLRHWCSREIRIPIGLRRCHFGLFLFQPPRRDDRVLLFMLRSCLWTPPDGALAILVWMVGCEVQYVCSSCPLSRTFAIMALIGFLVVAALNVIACVGWSAANAIVGAQLLNAVNGTVPGYAGILIITFCTCFITFCGYKFVHAYEYWSWIPTCIVFFIMLGMFAHSGDFINIPMGVGISEMGSCLSFGSTVYGFATGWTSFAADYTVYQPKTQSRRLIFLSAWVGLIVPLLFTQFLGIAIMSATDIGDGYNNKYAEGYRASVNGGLIAAVLEPLGGFGKFCLVILALSIVANNCPNIYSVGLTLQVLGQATQRVPRFIWTFIASCVSLAIGIPGYDHFETVLENFMSLIAYWLSIYSGISLAEHFVFRRGFGGYRVEDHDKPEKLPMGIAASIAFVFGIVGIVVGMSQSWWTGPIGRAAGDPAVGGDVGFELAFAFSFFVYCLARPVELRWTGR